MLQAGAKKRCRFSCSPTFKAGPSIVDGAPKQIELIFQHLSSDNLSVVRPGETKIQLQAHYGLPCTREVVNKSGKEVKHFKFLFASASNTVQSSKISIQENADNRTDDARNSKPVKLPVTDSSGTLEYVWDGSKVVAIEKEREQSIKPSSRYGTKSDSQNVMDENLLDGIRWKTLRCIRGVRCAFFPSQNDVTPGKLQMSRMYLK